jgi:hypothetical protein
VIGDAAKEKLIPWRAKLIAKLDRSLNAEDVAMLGRVELAIFAIDVFQAEELADEEDPASR